MNDPAIPVIRLLSEAESYTQDEPGEAYFHMLMQKDEIPGMQMGHVHLKGPIHKTPGAHDEFHQTYFIYEGAATIHLRDEQRTLQAPAVIMIPKATMHSVEVAEGNELRYVFVNQFR